MLTPPADWDDMVESAAAASIYHRTDWLQLVADVFGHPIWYLQARDANSKLVGLLPLVQQRSLLFGNFLTSLPFFNYGGPLASSELAMSSLLQNAEDLAKQLRVGHVELRTGIDSSLGWHLRTDKVTMLLDLPPTSAALSKQLGSKLRSQIKRADRENPQVAVGGSELTDEFYFVFCRNMRQLGTPVYQRDFFQAILERFTDSAQAVVVRVGGKPVAAALLVHYRGTTEIPWAACLDSMKPLGMNMRLYWECLKAAVEHGSRRFDFGRSSRDAGTFRFKAQWGAQPAQLYWHYWLPEGEAMPQLHHGNRKMALAIMAWQHMPLWFCNLVGPQIVRSLP